MEISHVENTTKLKFPSCKRGEILSGSLKKKKKESDGTR